MLHVSCPIDSVPVSIPVQHGRLFVPGPSHLSHRIQLPSWPPSQGMIHCYCYNVLCCCYYSLQCTCIGPIVQTYPLHKKYCGLEHCSPVKCDAMQSDVNTCDGGDHSFSSSVDTGGLSSRIEWLGCEPSSELLWHCPVHLHGIHRQLYVVSWNGVCVEKYLHSD
jgi:hypothetical protein